MPMEIIWADLLEEFKEQEIRANTEKDVGENQHFLYRFINRELRLFEQFDY